MGHDQLRRCLAWAVEKHDGQWREGEDPLPYVTHPIEVLTLLRQVGGVRDCEMLCAALLHDLVEETDTTLDEIALRAGGACASLVAELTRREPEASQTQGLSKEELWSLRADMLVQDVRAMGDRAKTIKLCDRISNLREARATKGKKQLGRYVWQTWRIMDEIPRKVNPGLWDCLKKEALSFGARP